MCSEKAAWYRVRVKDGLFPQSETKTRGRDASFETKRRSLAVCRVAGETSEPEAAQDARIVERRAQRRLRRGVELLTGDARPCRVREIHISVVSRDTNLSLLTRTLPHQHTKGVFGSLSRELFLKTGAVLSLSLSLSLSLGGGAGRGARVLLSIRR